jgi:hypothetical protein
MVSLSQIFNWFKTGLKPTEEQFKDTFSSFWHKSEHIPSVLIDGNYNTATSLDNFPTDKTLLIVSLSQNGITFTPDGELQGNMMVILKNETAGELTQTVPDGNGWVSWDGPEIVIPAGGLAEMNIIRGDSNYVMFKVKE